MKRLRVAALLLSLHGAACSSSAKDRFASRFRWLRVIHALSRLDAPGSPPERPAERVACGDNLRDLTRNLTERVHIEFWYTKAVDDNWFEPSPEYMQRTWRVLQALGAASNGTIEVARVPVASDDDRRRASEMGLTDTSGHITGLVVYYRDVHAAVVTYPDEYEGGLEAMLAVRVHEVVSRADGPAVRVGVIAGGGRTLDDARHVSPDKSDAKYSFRARLRKEEPSYELVPVDLGAPIDPALRALIVLQPGREYSEEELRRIDAFLMRGGRGMAVFAGAANIRTDAAPFELDIRPTGLEPLLRGYGVELRPEVIFDWEHGVVLGVSVGPTREVALTGVVEAKSTRNGRGLEPELEEALTKVSGVGSLVFPFASPLVVHADAQPAGNLQVIARTSGRTTVMADKTVTYAAAEPEAPGAKPDQAGPARGLLVLGDGAFHSAFVGADSQADADSTAVQLRLFVASSGYFLADPFVYAKMPDGKGGTARMLGGFAEQYGVTSVGPWRTFIDLVVWLAPDDALKGCEPAAEAWRGPSAQRQ